ncbi:MAG: hypothetical protein ACKOAD_04965 [Gammaproteobacteria bacterium]
MLTEIFQGLSQTLTLWLMNMGLALSIALALGYWMQYLFLESSRPQAILANVKLLLKALANLPFLILILLIIPDKFSPLLPLTLVAIPYLSLEFLKIIESYDTENWRVFKNYGFNFSQFFIKIFLSEQRIIISKKITYFAIYSLQFCLLTEAFTSHGLGKLLVLKAYPDFDLQFLLLSAVLLIAIGLLIKLSYDWLHNHFKNQLLVK